jgi:hypothetical protein
VSAGLWELDETLASGSEHAATAAPEGPDLFPLAPRSQVPVLGLRAIGLEDPDPAGCCSPDGSMEVGYTAAVFVATLDLGLGPVLIKGSLEGLTLEPKPWGTPSPSLL